MKRRPIPFRPELVRSILEDRKTRTRRVVKPAHMHIEGGDAETALMRISVDECPYGQRGDQLWVRESHKIGTELGTGGANEVIFQADNKRLRVADLEKRRLTDEQWLWLAETWMAGYRRKGLTEATYHDDRMPWRPARFMPKFLARLLLEIESVCVERLHDISEQDAQREGLEQTDGSFRSSFERVWREIQPDFLRIIVDDKVTKVPNPARWDANPWVWVITFKVLEAA